MAIEEDSFFLNLEVCGKAKQILSQVNISLLDYQSLLVDYAELSIIDQTLFTPKKTTYKAFYQRKIVTAEVYNLETIEEKIDLMVQISIMKSLNNDHLVGIIGVGYFQFHIDLPPQVLVLTEYFENNFETVLSLEDYFLHWKEKLQILKDIISALLLLEKYSITLREFSSNKIFLTNNLKCKIKCNYEIISKLQNDPKKNINSSELFVAYGKIIFQVITGLNFQQFFSSSNPNFANQSIDSIKLLDGCPEKLKILMNRCLDHQRQRANNPFSHGAGDDSTVGSDVSNKGTNEIHSIDEIWKELDLIWNITFPESLSNQILRRNSLSTSVANMKVNPFDDDDSDLYYQDPNYQAHHRPSTLSRRPTVPSRQSMSNIFAQFDSQPPSLNQYSNNNNNQPGYHSISRQASSDSYQSHVQPYDPYNDPYFNQQQQQQSTLQHRPSQSLPPLHPNSFHNSQSQAMQRQSPQIVEFPMYDRKEDLMNSLVDYTKNNLETLDRTLHQQLEVVENMYIIEATDGSNNSSSTNQASPLRESIDYLFQKLENVKKQLIFLYLYCDLEGNPDVSNPNNSQNIQDHLIPIIQNQQELDQERRNSNNKLIAMIQDILNDASTVPNDGAHPGNGGHYEFYRRNSSHPEMKRRLSLLRQETVEDPNHSARHRLQQASPQMPEVEMNDEEFDNLPISEAYRRQSLQLEKKLSSSKLKNPPTEGPVQRRSSSEKSPSPLPGGSPTGQKKKSFVVNSSDALPPAPQRAVSTGSLASVKEIRKSFIGKESAETSEDRKPSFRERQPSKDNIPPPPPPPPMSSPTSGPKVQQKTSTELNKDENNQPQPAPPTAVPSAPPARGPSLHEKLFNESSDADHHVVQKEIHTEEIISKTVQFQSPAPTNAEKPMAKTTTPAASTATPNKGISPAAADMANRRRSVLQMAANNSSSQGATNNQSPLAPSIATISQPTSSKIPGIVVGRKNSLILVENKVTQDFKVRKQSLYRVNNDPMNPAGGDLAGIDFSQFSVPMTADELGGSPESKNDGKYFPADEENENDYDLSKSNIPFAASSINVHGTGSIASKLFDNNPPLPPETSAANIQPSFSSNQPNYTNNNANNNNASSNSPVKFIHGKSAPGANLNNSLNNPEYSHSPKLSRTPLEKANEFINRVKMLDSVYLTRSQNDTFNPSAPGSANVDLNNGNVSYLHNNTFTGAIYRSPVNTATNTNSSSSAAETQSSSKNHLTHALTNFLKVIEKCNDTSSKAKLLVNQMDAHQQQQPNYTDRSSVRSTSPGNSVSSSSSRYMTHTQTSSAKMSPGKKRSASTERRLQHLANTFHVPNSPSSSPNRLRPTSTVLSGEAHRKVMQQTTNQVNINGRQYHNFFDNNQQNNLNNSFQSLYNVNNNQQQQQPQQGNGNAFSSNTSVTSSSRGGQSPGKLPSTGDRSRSKSPRTRYSIHQEMLSTNKSPVTFSFSPGKKR